MTLSVHLRYFYKCSQIHVGFLQQTDIETHNIYTQL